MILVDNYSIGQSCDFHSIWETQYHYGWNPAHDNGDFGDCLLLGLPHCCHYSGYDIYIYICITVINFIGLKVSCHFNVGQSF